MRKTGIEHLTQKTESAEDSELFRATLGFDFVFMRENGRLKCYCIEFNGHNSGLKGVTELPKEEVEPSHRTIATLRSAHGKKSVKAYERLRNYYAKGQFKNRPHLSLIANALERNLKSIGISDLGYSNPDFLQKIASNKKLQIPYIPEKNAPRYWKLGESTQSKSGYWALKKVIGSQGNDVLMLSNEELENEVDIIGEDVQEGTIVVQELINSNGTQLAQGGQKNKAACMRLHMDFRYLKDGSIVSDFRTAYQRIAPYARDQVRDNHGRELSNEDLLVVNKSRGADSVSASPMEIKMAREVAEKIIHNIANEHIKFEGMLPPLAPRESFAEESLKGIEKALMTVYERYEEPEGHDELVFHNTAHTNAVVKRCLMILGVIPGVKDEDVPLTTLAAAFHDTVQNWKPVGITEKFNGKEFTKVLRKRFSGENEAKSAEELITFMCETRKKYDFPVFLSTHEEAVREAIMATVPDFDKEHHTVFQPNLTKDSSLVARTLALADLGTAGIAPEKFIEEGDSLFREENLDILDASKNFGTIDDEHKAYFKHRMFVWTKNQLAFVEGRKQRFEEEITGFPEVAVPKLKQLFSGFDESIELIKRKIEKREYMEFEEIAADMGY